MNKFVSEAHVSYEMLRHDREPQPILLDAYDEEIPAQNYLTLSDSQKSMYDAMANHARERLSSWNVSLLKRFFNITTLKNPTNIGAFTWSCRQMDDRWIKLDKARNYGGGYVTPADLARDYLAIKFEGRKARCTNDEWRAAVGQRQSPPLLSKPGMIEQGAYLDMSGAYWQILRATGWNVTYAPESRLIRGKPLIDFPFPAEKLARNCLVSVGLNSPMRLWTGEELKFVKRPNRFINLVLWRLVMDVLNGIAYDMAELGAKYIFTDGYILPQIMLNDAIDVFDNWGIYGKIKHIGRFIVKAPAAYSCYSQSEGYYETRNFNRFRHEISQTKLYDPGRDWLRPRFKKYADYAKAEWEWMRS